MVVEEKSNNEAGSPAGLTTNASHAAGQRLNGPLRPCEQRILNALLTSGNKRSRNSLANSMSCPCSDEKL